MSSTYNRVFNFNSKEPKGHCEAVRQRSIKALQIANIEIQRGLKGLNNV